MSWGEIKSALNSTVGKNMKPLDDIVKSVADDNFYYLADILPSITAGGAKIYPYGIKEITLRQVDAIDKMAIVLPSTLEKIGSSAFEGSAVGSTIRLPNSLIEIGASAFASCANLQSIFIPKSVSKIGNFAFGYCGALSAVVFEGKPSDISASAFVGSESITDIFVPWSEGEVENAPWGATQSAIHYDYHS